MDHDSFILPAPRTSHSRQSDSEAAPLLPDSARAERRLYLLVPLFGIARLSSGDFYR
jgi:hypothetical protein